MSVSFASPALPTTRLPLGSETTGLAGGGEGLGGGCGAPTGMGASKPGPRYCLCLNSSPLPPQYIFHTAPRASFLKHKLNPDTASLKNFPWLPIPWRPRVKFLIMAFKACLPSFLHLFLQKKKKACFEHLLCFRKPARYTRGPCNKVTEELPICCERRTKNKIQINRYLMTTLQRARKAWSGYAGRVIYREASLLRWAHSGLSEEAPF